MAKLHLVRWGGIFGIPKSKTHIWSSTSGWHSTGGTLCGVKPKHGGADNFSGVIQQVTCEKCRTIQRTRR